MLARRKCDPLVAQYVECTKEHTFTVFWQCKAAIAAVNACMNELTNEAAEVEPVVDALVKSHAEFEVRKDRYKKALAK